MVQSKTYQQIRRFSNCAVIVAHPDDETLWAGGIILMHTQAMWTVITLCRKNDPDRSPRFFKALKELRAVGDMGALDDGPEQLPLADREVQDAITSLLPANKFDLIITHSPLGEYTRHLRHQETAGAVTALWENEKLLTRELWTFAYEDGEGKYLPQPVQNADVTVKLPGKIWQKKCDIITDIYGFASNSFEAKTTPHQEAFWCFNSSQQLYKHFNSRR